jgi:hypothetical protein
VSRADQIDLIHPGGTIALIRCQAPEFTEEADLASFRAPFGTTWHGLGTGHQLPTQVLIRGVLEGGAFDDTDDLLEQLLAALPSVSQIQLGDWRVPVRGAVGLLNASPTLTAYAVTVALLLDDGAWQPANNLTADSSLYTADSTSFTADQVGTL